MYHLLYLLQLIVEQFLIDNVSSDLTCDNGNIMTEMLLASHVKGFVENPGYYFEADDAEHRRHLDLLLMVQGWRRFDIKQPEIVEPYEKSQMIIGEVCKYTPLDQEDLFYLGMSSPDAEQGYMRHGYGGPLPLYALGGGSLFLPFAYIPSEESPDPSFPLWYSKEKEDAPQQNQPESLPLKTYDYEYLDVPNKKTHLHAEFIQPGSSPVYGDMTVKEDGKFSIQAPHFGGYCFMHLAASSLEKLSKADKKDEKKKEKQSKKGKGWKTAHQWL